MQTWKHEGKRLKVEQTYLVAKSKDDKNISG